MDKSVVVVLERGYWGPAENHVVGNSRIRHKFAKQCQEISKTEDVTKNEKETELFE